MPKIKIFISIFIFSIFLSVTSYIKTQTRIIEKKIKKINGNVAFIKKDLHETQLDYFYLSSPGKLFKKIQEIGSIEYTPMEFSKIYLSYQDFINAQKKITTYQILNEKNKIKKK